MIDVSPLTAALRGAAICLGGIDRDIMLEFGHNVGGKCSMVIRCRADAESLESRAVNLERAARRDHRTRGDFRWPSTPTMRQARYSAAVAQRFLDDGERDNYLAYCALYS